MNKVKLYKIYAIADQLQKTDSDIYKLEEIKDLCEEIVIEHDNDIVEEARAFNLRWNKTICSKI